MVEWKLWKGKDIVIQLYADLGELGKKLFEILKIDKQQDLVPSPFNTKFKSLYEEINERCWIQESGILAVETTKRDKADYILSQIIKKFNLKMAETEVYNTELRSEI